MWKRKGRNNCFENMRGWMA